MSRILGSKVFSLSSKPVLRTCAVDSFRPRTIQRFSTGKSQGSPIPQTPLKKTNNAAFWGLGAAVVGTGLFLFSRGQKENKEKKKEVIKVTEQTKLQRLPDDITMVFVLGGPGAGKGTQCANLVRDFGFLHLSVGDLLRAERETPNSPYGNTIESFLKEGKLVPIDITLSLLYKAIVDSNSKRILIDGFPRSMDQVTEFEKALGSGKLVLYFDCPEEVMLKRLLKRSETSGRIDDNEETIKKRFRTFVEASLPVIEYYEKQGKSRKISCLNPPDEVYAATKPAIEELFHK